MIVWTIKRGLLKHITLMFTMLCNIRSLIWKYHVIMYKSFTKRFDYRIELELRRTSAYRNVSININYCTQSNVKENVQYSEELYSVPLNCFHVYSKMIRCLKNFITHDTKCRRPHLTYNVYVHV